MRDDLIDIGELGVSEALKRGATEVETYISWGRSLGVKIEHGQISFSTVGIDNGIGIRVAVGKRVGFAYANSLSPDKVKEVAERAVSAAKASREDKDWRGLPEPRTLPTVEDVFDDRIIKMDVDEVSEIAKRMLDSALEYDKRVIPINGGVSVSYGTVAIVNSKGIRVEEKGTLIYAGLATIARDGTKVSPVCYETDHSRVLKIDPEWVGREAARLAVEALKTEKVSPGRYPVIFDQEALSELWEYTLTKAVQADFVQRDRSALKGKLGEQVASEILTIIDDGIRRGGYNTGSFDGEGVPSQRTVIIESGILRGYLYDNYTAKKENRSSTGNAARSPQYGPVAVDYASTPSIAPTNFTVIEGDFKVDEMISEIKEGFYVRGIQGAHSSNPESGEISVVATPCWKIERGEVKHAVQGAMIAGNMFEMLKRIAGIANNTRQFFYLVSPWIMVENVRIVSK